MKVCLYCPPGIHGYCGSFSVLQVPATPRCVLMFSKVFISESHRLSRVLYISNLPD